MSSSAWSKRTGARRPRRCSRVSKSCRASPSSIATSVLHEFDLDAALARRPGLLLVDEFAHTNVPGSRHPKRWQDVEELLDAGIDVWTTLNIQHLESLNDVIQKITGVRVRETVPDSVFEKADEIVLVDIPPDELLKRLAEGKVYVQDTAGRAVQNFFKPQNLTALRELALRRAAERVDSDLVERMQANAIEGPWAAGERILVCVGPDTVSPTVVRTAKRLADLMDAPWLAVTVERPTRPLAPEGRRRRRRLRSSSPKSWGPKRGRWSATTFPAEVAALCEIRERRPRLSSAAPPAVFGAQLFRRSLPHELLAPGEGHRDSSGHGRRGRAGAGEDTLCAGRISVPVRITSGRHWQSRPLLRSGAALPRSRPCRTCR